MKVLVAGVSARAPAESAACAGFSVTSLDAFADVDHHPSVRALALDEPFSPGAAARRAQRIDCDAVAYGANFENHPDAITMLAEGRALWGNHADAVRRVRDPLLLSRALRRRGLATPDVIADPSRIPNPESQAWLVKPRRSGGGHGVRRWAPGSRVPRGYCLQAFIDGVPASMVFVAARQRAVPIGFSRQLIGDDAFGSSGFQYCGNVLTAGEDGDSVVRQASDMARALSEEFDLVGVNGLDLIVRDGHPYAIEVNPRWSASMELVERAYGLSVFGAHSAACRDGALPGFDLMPARRGAQFVVGKAVVFAREDVIAPDTTPWLADADIRDVPQAGTPIPAGRPVCTVFGEGPTAAECYLQLVRHAARIYGQL